MINKLIKNTFSLLIIFLFLVSCNQKKEKTYVISEKLAQIDSLKCKKKELDSIKTFPPPPIDTCIYTYKPSLNGIFQISGLPDKNYYFKLVFILDTTNLVYLYQTETVPIDLVRANIQKKERYNHSNEDISELQFSDFIGLKPEYLLTFKSEYMISFIEENKEIFELDTINKYRRKIFVLASTTDIIQNPFFYKIKDYINGIDNHYSSIVGLVRMTSEEENVVLAYKKKNKPYNPKNINWSTNFLDGNCRPFSTRYDSIKNNQNYIIKAIPTINRLGSDMIFIQ